MVKLRGRRFQSIDPGVAIFGIVSLWAGVRPNHWQLDPEGAVNPYLSVDGENASLALMEIVTEIADPGLVYLVQPSQFSYEEIILSATVSGPVRASRYPTLVFPGGDLTEVATRLWEAYQPIWNGDHGDDLDDLPQA